MSTKIRMKKRFGQHFLMEERTRHRIVEYANITDRDTVLEVGAGTGNLTSDIKDKAGKVIAVEKDRDFVEILRKRFSNDKNVAIIEGDILKVDLPHYNKVVSTPPYNISSKLIFLLLDRYYEIIVITLQKDFAERLVAKPGSKDFGRITLMVEYKAHVELLESISRNEFYPKPKVDSAIVKIVSKEDIDDFTELDSFKEFVRILFTQRRKNLRKVVIHYLKFKFGMDADRIISNIKLFDKRVYELSADEFKTLFRQILAQIEKIDRKS